MNDTLSVPLLLYAAAVFMLAGWIKGVVGMGLPIVSMAALSMVVQPVQAAALLCLPSLLTNTWQASTGPALRPLGLRLAPLLGASVIGTLLGIPMLTSGHSLLPPLLLGTVLLLYAMTALYLRPFQVPMNRQGWGGPVVGGLTGVLAGATGINAVPLVPYLNSIGLSKDELVQALGLCFTVSTLSLAGALVWKGQFPSQLFFASMAAVLPALMGMSLGQRARGRVSSAAFRRWFLYAMLAMGAYMALRASWKLLA